MSDQGDPSPASEQPLLGLISSYETTPIGGVPVGTAVHAAPNSSVVISRQGQPLAVLPTGEHVLDPRTMTALAPAFELTSDHREVLHVAIWHIRTDPVRAQWESDRFAAKGMDGQVSDMVVKGVCWVKVSDVGRFYGQLPAAVQSVKQLQEKPAEFAQRFPSFSRAGRDAISIASGDFRNVADYLVLSATEGAVDDALSHGGIPKDPTGAIAEPFRAALGAAVAQRLGPLGLECTAFGIDGVEAISATCRICGSAETE